MLVEYNKSFYRAFWGSVLLNLCKYHNTFHNSNKIGNDACQGDSGGPLFAQRPNHLKRPNANSPDRMELIGITSFGQKCGLNDTPGGYTRVNRFLKWIMYAMTNITPKTEVCNGFLGNWVHMKSRRKS